MNVMYVYVLCVVRMCVVFGDCWVCSVYVVACAHVFARVCVYRDMCDVDVCESVCM